MISKLFTLTTDEGQELDDAKRTWIAKVIGGAIVSDGHLHQNERPYLQELFDEFPENSPDLLKIRNIIKLNEPPVMEPIELPAKHADRILKAVLEVCSCDHELSPGEIRFVNEVGMALGIPVTRVHKLINYAVRKVKVEFFNELLMDLHEEERLWLASLTLKSIYADGTVDKREIPYFNDVYELLEGDPKLLEKVKKEARDPDISNLPKVHFEHSLAERILKYLLEITLNDESLDDRELTLVHEVALQLQFDEHELNKLIDSVEAIKFFMHASSELIDSN